MATVYKTTMTPTKLELIAAWRPKQDWYVGRSVPELSRAGGFRLDDPAGEVGIEFIVIGDRPGDQPVYYLVPLTYRGSPVADLAPALLGTSAHGVLGTRWIYDGAADPVLLAQLSALVRGEAEAQQQSESDTPEPRVVVTPTSSDVVIRRVLQPSAASCPVSGFWEDVDGAELRGEFVSVRP